ncbi:DUF3040 domain-containing protein [Arthrobacter sp. NPDC092385]|uniref:DUF3040 domain-containing protein n=1 Tax=Arthrobacter sp. NPDC092385 TaxID=3363943 RepID=UPI00382AFB4F
MSLTRHERQELALLENQFTALDNRAFMALGPAPRSGLRGGSWRSGIGLGVGGLALFIAGVAVNSVFISVTAAIVVSAAVLCLGWSILGWLNANARAFDHPHPRSPA